MHSTVGATSIQCLNHNPLQSPFKRIHVQRGRRCLRTPHSRPEDALRQACDEQGIRFKPANAEDDEEDWEDVQEEMEDFWMRSPKAPSEFEIAEGAALGEDKSDNTPAAPVQESITLSECQRLTTAPHVLFIGSDDHTSLMGVANLVSRESWQGVKMEEVTRDLAEGLQQFPLVILVSDADVKVRQAFTRLTRVYGLTNVKWLEGGGEEM